MIKMRQKIQFLLKKRQKNAKKFPFSIDKLTKMVYNTVHRTLYQAKEEMTLK
jgi:hypothetical protein